MTKQLEDLEADIKEFEALLKLAQRPAIVEILKVGLENAVKEHTKLLADNYQPKKLAEEEEKKNPDDTYSFDTEFVSITKFGWDQEGAKVKVYVTSGIDGVGSLDKNQIACDFKKVGPNHMMDLRIYGLNGANYRLKLP